MPARPSRHRHQALKAEGALHPHPERVTDPRFCDSTFFDPHDLVQVKYEMLRRVRVEKQSVSATAAAFGFSRPAFYQARKAFDREGLAGLLPRKRGPRGPHKLTDEVLGLLDAHRREDGSVPGARELARYLEVEHAVKAHPRSIERSLSRYRTRREKKPRRNPDRLSRAPG
ncbi:helix-turn-helix domain-containing protein, partial [Gemmatimonadota bacterium]